MGNPWGPLGGAAASNLNVWPIETKAACSIFFVFVTICSRADRGCTRPRGSSDVSLASKGPGFSSIYDRVGPLVSLQGSLRFGICERKKELGPWSLHLAKPLITAMNSSRSSGIAFHADASASAALLISAFSFVASCSSSSSTTTTPPFSPSPSAIFIVAEGPPAAWGPPWAPPVEAPGGPPPVGDGAGRRSQEAIKLCCLLTLGSVFFSFCFSACCCSFCCNKRKQSSITLRSKSTSLLWGRPLLCFAPGPPWGPRASGASYAFKEC